MRGWLKTTLSCHSGIIVKAKAHGVQVIGMKSLESERDDEIHLLSFDLKKGRFGMDDDSRWIVDRQVEAQGLLWWHTGD